MTKHKHESHTGRNIAIALLVIAVVAGLGWYALQDPTIEAWVFDVLSIGAEREIIGTTWSWDRTEFRNGTRIHGPGGDAFLLTFGEDGRLASTTDCNSVFGEYSLIGRGIRVGELASTLKACPPDSLEAEYAKELARASAFNMNSRQLDLFLEDDTGIMTFSRRK